VVAKIVQLQPSSFTPEEALAYATSQLDDTRHIAIVRITKEGKVIATWSEQTVCDLSAMALSLTGHAMKLVGPE
jgi:hypothetical protein